MSKYAELDGYIYFPPQVIGGPTGDYEAKCPLDTWEEAEYTVLAIATQDNGTPRILISTNMQPKQLVYDGSTTLGLRSGTDQGAQFFPGIALSQNGLGAWNPPLGEYFPIVDSQGRIFVRIDIAAANSAYVTLRYRVRPVKQVVAQVVQVHEDHEQQHNIARADAAYKRLNAGKRDIKL